MKSGTPSALRQARAAALLEYLKQRNGIALTLLEWDNLRCAGYSRAEAQTLIDDLHAAGMVEIRQQGPHVDVLPTGQEAGL